MTDRSARATRSACVSIERKLGINASPTCVMAYDGAVGHLIGEVNQGMRYMFTMMNTARLSVGMEGLALAERAYQQAVAYANERRQGRAPGAVADSLIVEHVDVRRMLVSMRVHIEAMRGIAYLNAEAIDIAKAHPDAAARAAGQERAEILTPITKGWCTDVGVEMTSLAVQVHGGMGYIEETGVAQHFRDARIAPIYEGTNGIQAMDLVGRKLGLRGGQAMADFIGAMTATAVAARSAGGEIGAVGAALEDALGHLTAATQWLQSNAAADPNNLFAGATPYLRLAGIVTGGWVLTTAALAAADLRSGDGGGFADDFLDQKLVSARYFARQVLPQAAALVPAVTAGPADLFAATF